MNVVDAVLQPKKRARKTPDHYKPAEVTAPAPKAVAAAAQKGLLDKLATKIRGALGEVFGEPHLLDAVSFAAVAQSFMCKLH